MEGERSTALKLFTFQSKLVLSSVIDRSFFFSKTQASYNDRFVFYDRSVVYKNHFDPALSVLVGLKNSHSPIVCG